MGDFFAAGWGSGYEPNINSLAVCVNPRSGLNSYWQMPFRENCGICRRGKYRSMIGQYRWHILDPVRFKEDLKITIQSLGWKSGGRYKHLDDDLSSVAFWYQNEPHNPFPALPSAKELLIGKNE